MRFENIKLYLKKIKNIFIRPTLVVSSRIYLFINEREHNTIFEFFQFWIRKFIQFN